MVNLMKTSATEWTWTTRCQPEEVGGRVICQRPGRVGHNYLHLTVTQVESHDAGDPTPTGYQPREHVLVGVEGWQ